MLEGFPTIDTKSTFSPFSQFSEATQQTFISGGVIVPSGDTCPASTESMYIQRNNVNSHETRSYSQPKSFILALPFRVAVLLGRLYFLLWEFLHHFSYFWRWCPVFSSKRIKFIPFKRAKQKLLRTHCRKESQGKAGLGKGSFGRI